MGKGAGKGGLVTYDSGNICKIIFQMQGSVLKTVYPNMLIAMTIAVRSCQRQALPSLYTAIARRAFSRSLAGLSER